jgi:hypothetical protein
VVNRSGLGVTTKLSKLTFDSRQCQRELDAEIVSSARLKRQKIVRRTMGRKVAAYSIRPLKQAASAIISGMTFLYILLGLMIGVLSGIVGIGGGIMIVPALIYFFHMSQHKAQGTSLAALLVPAGALAFWEYYKAGNVDIKAGLFIALGFLVGGYFGGLWAQHLSELVLRRVFGTLLVIIGIRLLLQR